MAIYWKGNHDLRHIMERDWQKFVPQLKGKIHLYCADMDDYYLNNAVKLTEEFPENTRNSYHEGKVAYRYRV